MSPHEHYDKRRRWAPLTTTNGIIFGEALRYLGVTKYRLGQLLDIPADHVVYRWSSGRALIGQAYTLKVLHLVLQKAKGELDLNNFDPKEYWDGFMGDPPLSNRAGALQVPQGAGRG